MKNQNITIEANSETIAEAIEAAERRQTIAAIRHARMAPQNPITSAILSSLEERAKEMGITDQEILNSP